MSEIIDVSKGLHRIKDDIRLEYMNAQADSLREQLDEAIEVTRKMVPPERTESYNVGHGERRHLENRPAPGEAEWEEALWRARERLQPDLYPHCGILDYQVPLKDSHADTAWGKVDLLGFSHAKEPAVIELKVSPGETLLRAIVEATAYGIAVQKNLRKIARDFKIVLDSVNLPSRCRLFCFGPAEWWENLSKPSRNWQPIEQLCAELGDRGFPVMFGEVKSDGRDGVGLPEIMGVKLATNLTALAGNRDRREEHEPRR